MALRLQASPDGARWITAKRGRVHHVTGGRGQRWVCISQLMRVSTDRLHHQHPTPIAVEDSVPDITEPRQHRRIIPRSAGAGVTLLSSDNIVC